MYMYSNMISAQLFMHVSTRLKNACFKHQVLLISYFVVKYMYIVVHSQDSEILQLVIS